MNNSEKNLALRQGHEIASEDGYFEARPQIDTLDRRKVFGAGFERGWDEALAALPTQTGYREFFYTLGKLMDIPAPQFISPQRVWLEQMLPRLKELLAAPAQPDKERSHEG